MILPKWIRNKIKIRPDATSEGRGSRKNKRSDAMLNSRKSSLIALSYVPRSDIAEFFRDILSLGAMPENLSSSFRERKDWLDRQQKMSNSERELETLESNLRKEAVRLLPRVNASEKDTKDNKLFLNRLLEIEKKSIVKEEILFSLGKLGDETKLEELISISKNDQIGLRRRRAALVGLANIKSNKVDLFLKSIAFNLSEPLADTAFSCLAFREGLLGDEFVYHS